MKKIKFLLLGIVSFLGIGLSSASFTISGVTYEDGFYRNENKGLITFIQGENIATFQDKNVGATEVYDGTTTSLGSLMNVASNSRMNSSTSPCSQLGNLYQWGNDYPFSCPGVYNGEYNLSSIINLDSSVTYSRNGTHLNTSSLYNPTSLTQSSFDAWGGVTSTPESQQGVCPDGYYIPNKVDVENFESMLGGYFGIGKRNSRNYISADGYSLSYYLKLPVYSYNVGGAFPEYSSNFLSSSSFLGYRNRVFQKYFGFRKNTDNDMNLLVANDNQTYYFLYYFNSSNGPYISTNANYSTPAVLAPVRCFRNLPLLPSNSWVALTGGDTSILPPEIDQPEPNDPWGSGYIVITGSNTSSLYYNCLGPVYNTPDGLPPAYCFDSSGELNPGRFQNCFDTLEYIDNGVITHTFCSIDGFQQEVNLVEDGSGYSLVPGQNISNFLDYFNSGYSVEYFEEFLNKTGYFFKCPFPYTQKFVVRPKLISLLNGFDLAVPINCAFAGFEQGKNLFTFPNSGHFVQSGPILNFEGENANVIYRFFDFCIILVFILLLSKVFKLFK